MTKLRVLILHSLHFINISNMFWKCMPLVGGRIWGVTWFPTTLQKSIKFFLAYTKVQIEFHVIWLTLFIENAFSLLSWLLPTIFLKKSHMIAKLAFNPFFGAYKRSSHFPCLGCNSPLHKQFVVISSMDFHKHTFYPTSMNMINITSMSYFKLFWEETNWKFCKHKSYVFPITNFTIIIGLNGVLVIPIEP
jgi:hypothetical protein